MNAPDPGWPYAPLKEKDSGRNGSAIVPAVREVLVNVSGAASADQVVPDGSCVVAHDRMGDSPALSLRLSGRFSLEQREAAEQIWVPVLQRLRPLLASVTRLESSDTPNGLIAESAEGWTLALCCLAEQPLPHVVAVRDHREDGSPGVQALLSEGGYVLGDHEEKAAALQSLLKAVVRRLGGRRAEEPPSSGRRGSPRRVRALKTRRAQRLSAA